MRYPITIDVRGPYVLWEYLTLWAQKARHRVNGMTFVELYVHRINQWCNIVLLALSVEELWMQSLSGEPKNVKSNITASAAERN